MTRLANLARSLEGRAVAVLLIAILVVHAGALLLYRRSAVSAADEAFAAKVATQLALAREAVMRRPPSERTDEARALSSPHFETNWAEKSPLRPEEATGPFLWTLRNRILDLAPSLAGTGLALAIEGPGDAVDFQELKGALRLPDDTYLTFRSAHSPNLARIGPWALLSTLMAIIVGSAAVVLVHRIASPLRDLTRATGAIGHGPTVAVPETGPDETRSIGSALNEMQARIQRLVAQRTQALAAVSHDLRTPIARLRLRLDQVPDDGERLAMAADLDDMQAMVDSTLAYLRGETEPEARRMVNVASLIMSIVDAAFDAGRPVTYDGPSRALAIVRPVALRRTFENLIDNAVFYGTSARIRLEVAHSFLRITVDDDGHGIAPADRERVFEPFVRLEISRNRNTGGTGLGLTIAKQTVERDGGRITLEGGPTGGLRVAIELRRAGI